MHKFNMEPTKYCHYLLLFLLLMVTRTPSFAREDVLAPTVPDIPLVGFAEMLQDSEGYIWYASLKGGLCRDNGYQVDLFHNDRNKSLGLGQVNGVLSFCETSRGDICFGTRENVYLLHKQDYSITLLDSTLTTDERYRLIRQDRDGGILVARRDSVFFYNRDYKRLQTVPRAWVSQHLLDSLQQSGKQFVDKRGRRWRLIDSEPHIDLLSDQHFVHITDIYEPDPDYGYKCVSIGGTQFTGDNEGITAGETRVEGLGRIRQMVPAPQGGIYFVSVQVALGHCSDQGQVTILAEGELSKRLCVGQDGTVWTCGSQGQVWRYDAEAHQLVLNETASSPYCDPINAMAVDQNGVLCVLTDKRIKYYEPQSGKFRIISASNPGVGFRQFDLIANVDGRTQIYGSDGIFCLNPSSQDTSGEITLTGVTVGDSTFYPAPGTHRIVIPADAVNVNLQFSTFDHLNACDVVMQYSINGSRWITMPAGKNIIPLISLSRGTYRVDVRAGDAMSWGNYTTTIEVVRSAAWFETWWAWLIYALLFAMLIIAIEHGTVLYYKNERKLKELQQRIDQLLSDHDVRIENLPDEIASSEVDHAFIEKAIALVEKNMSDSDYDVQRFASDLGMSRATLYRMFSDTTGQKPLEFMRSIRLKRAEEMLSKEGLPVQYVAAVTGFASVSNFSKRFHEMFGVNPSQLTTKGNANGV